MAIKKATGYAISIPLTHATAETLMALSGADGEYTIVRRGEVTMKPLRGAYGCNAAERTAGEVSS